MYTTKREKLDNIKGFLDILDSTAPVGKQKEQVIQSYLELHSDMIPTNKVLNHQVLYDFIFTKFPINNSNVTDLLYITKSSVQYKIVLIELENCEKKIFTADVDKVIFSAEFNAAFQQVYNWKIEIEEHKHELLRNLDHMLDKQKYMNDPIYFDYQLIIGRSSEYEKNPNRKRHISMKQRDTGIEILTYDSLIQWYKNARSCKKDIIKLERDHYIIKNMDANTQSYFAYLKPHQIKITKEQKEELMKEGYQIEKWENGEPLIVNHKYADLESLKKARDEISKESA